MKKTGFTLLETIVALAVILAAVVGPVTLITRSILIFSFSKNKLIALNLAQEGLELVREIRENNIACDQVNGPLPRKWFSDPENGNLIVNESFQVAADQTIDMTCGLFSIKTPTLPLFAGTKFFLDPLTGVYGYNGPKNTIFSREITISQPLNDGNIQASEQRDVVSTVRWSDRGIDRNVALRDRMYNWR